MVRLTDFRCNWFDKILSSQRPSQYLVSYIAPTVQVYTPYNASTVLFMYLVVSALCCMGFAVPQWGQGRDTEGNSGQNGLILTPKRAENHR